MRCTRYVPPQALKSSAGPGTRRWGRAVETLFSSCHLHFYRLTCSYTPGVDHCRRARVSYCFDVVRPKEGPEAGWSPADPRAPPRCGSRPLAGGGAGTSDIGHPYPYCNPCSKPGQGVPNLGPDTAGGGLRSDAVGSGAQGKVSSPSAPRFLCKTQGSTWWRLRPPTATGRRARGDRGLGEGRRATPGSPSPDRGRPELRRRHGRAGTLARHRSARGCPAAPPRCDNSGSSSSSSSSSLCRSRLREQSPACGVQRRSRSPGAAAASTVTSLRALRCCERAGEGASPRPIR